MSFHSSIVAGANHIIHQWVYADSTARLAATGFGDEDVGKVALQSDTGHFWALSDYSPITWIDLSAAGAASAVSSVFGRVGAVVAAASDYDASQVDNDSSVSGSTVKDALDTLNNRVFGDSYQTAISLTRSTTTSTTFQTKVTLTTPALAAGTYRVGWTAVVDQNSIADAVESRLYNVTDGAVVGATSIHEPQDSGNRIHVGGFAEITFTGAAKTFRIEYRQQRGNTAGIQDARIEIWRVA